MMAQQNTKQIILAEQGQPCSAGTGVLHVNGKEREQMVEHLRVFHPTRWYRQGSRVFEYHSCIDEFAPVSDGYALEHLVNYCKGALNAIIFVGSVLGDPPLHPAEVPEEEQRVDYKKVAEDRVDYFIKLFKTGSKLAEELKEEVENSVETHRHDNVE